MKTAIGTGPCAECHKYVGKCSACGATLPHAKAPFYFNGKELPPSSAPEPLPIAFERAYAENEGEPVTTTNPRLILAGIKQFGLAADGADIRDLDAAVERLQRELHTMQTAGIIEVAVRNSNVAEYMNHWEARATAAEADRVEVAARIRAGSPGTAVEPAVAQQVSAVL